jgi:hypothetical protein
MPPFVSYDVARVMAPVVGQELENVASEPTSAETGV